MCKIGYVNIIEYIHYKSIEYIKLKFDCYSNMNLALTTIHNLHIFHKYLGKDLVDVRCHHKKSVYDKKQKNQIIHSFLYWLINKYNGRMLMYDIDILCYS